MARWGIGFTDRTWGRGFGERPWVDTRSFLGGMAASDPEFRYLVDVIDSVMDSGADVLLAGGTSMHDLMVTPHPVGPHVRDLIVVRAPSSLRPAATAGHVRIEHLSSTGYNDFIDRPPSDAVPLFWRFVLEKYGIRPPHRSV
ncbi:hypothetical protein AB0I34_30390 [Kribbella sp. NPDC050281]|uniref:hypothetical protein n=1 Tax=Kribbella sp. NPDC050281 TaxID=3155515 RepID=UPI0033DE7284